MADLSRRRVLTAAALAPLAVMTRKPEALYPSLALYPSRRLYPRS